jgi:hypothetical protein
MRRYSLVAVLLKSVALIAQALPHRQPRVLREAGVHFRELAQVEHRSAIRGDAAHVRASVTKPGNCGFGGHAQSLAALDY